MVQKERAPVRPRVVPSTGGTPVLLEDEVRSWLERGDPASLRLFGETGAGKTTALQHLASVLSDAAPLSLLDHPTPDALTAARLGEHVVVHTVTDTRAGLRGDDDACYQLAPWTEDDRIEYLLALHRDRCASVVERLQRTDDCHLPHGNAELWSAVLDRMARETEIDSVGSALRRAVHHQIPDPKVAHFARKACLRVVLSIPNEVPVWLDRWLEAGRLLGHRPVWTVLAAERVADDLARGRIRGYWRRHFPTDLIRAVGALLEDRPAGNSAGHSTRHDTPEELLAGVDRRAIPMLASVLLAADPDWAPARGTVPALGRAHLPKARWPEAHLAGAWLRGVNFDDADLRSANLERCDARYASMRRTLLNGARLRHLDASNGHLAGADLRGANARKSKFVDADLDGANLEGADFSYARLNDATLREARLRDAIFTRAVLRDARIAGADLTGANLSVATLDGLTLRLAILDGATFASSSMRNCDLECVVLDGPDFSNCNLDGAILTGSVLPRANLRGATLLNTGLAEVSWEGADLRGVDMRGATFHMGSARSGLVDSTIASEGSRTGFYTDESTEQTFLRPEEIRKANLRDIDMRGARIDGVDFYLVDLRGARYDSEHVAQLRSTKAIL